MERASPFIGRHQEVSSLRKELDRKRPSLVTVYGRRRVGKSTLLAQATRDRDTIFYQATQVLGSMNLDLLKEEVGRTLDEPDAVLEGIEHWEALLSYIAQLATERPGLTLVLDEFPYICETVAALPSIAQKVFDRISDRGVEFNLILCGSQISFMQELLGERNPLRGRQTHELELAPLTYREAAQFFPDWSAQRQLAAYGVFGGMPYYLQLCDPSSSFRENVEAVVLQPGAPLSNEAFNVLRAELTSPTRYASILEAVGSGCTTTGDILGRVRDISGGGALAPYIAKLEALRLIRITRSLDASPKARNRRYYITDPFLAFWYRFGLPNGSALATGHASEVYDHAIQPYFDGYMGDIFEWIAHQFVSHYGSEILSAPSKEVGKIWGGDYDVDVAATLLDDMVVMGECKWWDSPVGGNVLRDLQEDCRKTSYGKNASATHFLLVSKSGFTDELLELEHQSATLHLISPDELLGEDEPQP
jgi:AAA+ ATPase superfamily predicted ATPase